MATDLIQSHILKEFEKLKNSSTIIHSLIENTHLGLAVLTTDMRVVEANSKMREWFPFSQEDEFPLCYCCFFNRTGAPCNGCPAADCLSTGRKTTAIITNTAVSPPSDYKVSCTPLRGEDSAVWGVLEIVEDVTQEVAQERQLRDLESQHMQIIENASDAILTFNSSGDILRVNKSAQRLTGYAVDELKQKSVFELVPGHMREKQQHLLRKLFDQPGAISSDRVIEGVCRRKDGSLIPVEETYSFQRTVTGPTITVILRDISVRKHYEENLKIHAESLQQAVDAATCELARSEERYRSLVETANDAIISIDPEGTITYFNTRAEELYGFQRSDILGKSITEIAPKPFWHAVQMNIRGDDKTRQRKIIESHGITRHNTTFPVECTISVFEREGQRTITLIVRDITIRKNLAHELQEYTAKLEEKVRARTYELTESQQTLKSKVSELSILKEISEALASAMELEEVLNIILVGATSHHGLGFNRAFLFLISDDGRFLEGKVAIGPSDGSEAQRIWSDILGKKLTLKEILQSYINKAGRVDTYVNNVIRNIRIPLTDKNNVLIKVIREKTAINIHDAFDNPNVSPELLTAMNCNAFALIPLIAEDSVLGVLWADNTITKNPIDDHDMERLSAFAINASLAIEKSNLYKNIQKKVAELDSANRELRENRDRLIRSEKLAAVGEMSATVAHGIRNPLVSIGGFARRLLKKETQDTSSRKYLQIIVGEIDRLETMVTELLDFVRPRTLHLRKTKLEDLINDTLQIFSIAFENKHVTVEKHFAQDIPELEIDPGQFKRVLHNLFNNAVEAMPDGGEICLEVAVEDGMVHLSVSDTGTGVSEEDLEKVFHPFFTKKPTGSGLGLAVCNQIISILGGTITLKRKQPAGTVCDMLIPIVRQ